MKKELNVKCKLYIQYLEQNVLKEWYNFFVGNGLIFVNTGYTTETKET